MPNIKNIIRQLAQSDGETAALVCTVDAVDKGKRTIDCTPLNEGAPLLGVNLQANQCSGTGTGVVLFPKIGAFVVVGFIADGSASVMLCTDELESAELVIGGHSVVINDKGISLNGGTFGGLVKAKDLTDRLNFIEKDVNALKKIFSEWAVAPQDGGAALKTATTSWAMASLSETKCSDYEDTKVKH